MPITMNIGNIVWDCHNKITSGNLPSDSVLKFPDIPSSLDPFWPLKSSHLQELGWNSFKKMAFQLHPFKSFTSAFTTQPLSIMDPLCPRSTRHWNLVAPLTRLLHRSRPWPCHVLWVGCKRCPDSCRWVKLHHSGGTGSTTPKSIGTNHLFQTSIEVIPFVFLKNLNKNLVSKISTPNLWKNRKASVWENVQKAEVVLLQMINALVPSLHPTSETLSTTCVNYRIKLFSLTFQRKISQTSMIQPPPPPPKKKQQTSMEPIIHPPRPEHGLVSHPDLKVASCGGVNLATSSSMGAAWSRSNTFGEGAPWNAIENHVNI